MNGFKTTSCTVCKSEYTNIVWCTHKRISQTGMAFVRITGASCLLVGSNIAFAIACNEGVSLLFVASSAATWLLTLAWWRALLPSFHTTQSTYTVDTRHVSDVVRV